VPVVVIGLGLIWWDRRRNPKIVHHHSATVGLTGIQAVGAVGTLTPSVISSATPAKPTPDMSIHEVFFHVRPGLLEEPQEHRWQKVGRDIRDKLAIGELASWGREIDSKNKTHSALVEIPSRYWVKADFVYFFLDKTNGPDQPHSYTPGNSPTCNDYADIRFNRAQVVNFWPAVVRPSERDTSLGDAIAYASTGHFDKNAAFESTNGDIGKMGLPLKQFYQFARDGKMRVWGKLESHTPYAPIPADYWDNHNVYFMHLFKDQTDVEYGGSPPPHYKDVMVSRVECEKLWPR
jgi:hypothetical protein